MKTWVIEEVKEFTNWQKKGFFGQVCKKILKYFIKSKRICLSQRNPHVLPQASYGTIKPSRPMDIFGIVFLKRDHCSDGYEYILVIPDHFTRYI